MLREGLWSSGPATATVWYEILRKVTVSLVLCVRQPQHPVAGAADTQLQVVLEATPGIKTQNRDLSFL